MRAIRLRNAAWAFTRPTKSHPNRISAAFSLFPLAAVASALLSCGCAPRATAASSIRAPNSSRTVTSTGAALDAATSSREVPAASVALTSPFRSAKIAEVLTCPACAATHNGVLPLTSRASREALRCSNAAHTDACPAAAAFPSAVVPSGPRVSGGTVLRVGHSQSPVVAAARRASPARTTSRGLLLSQSTSGICSSAALHVNTGSLAPLDNSSRTTSASPCCSATSTADFPPGHMVFTRAPASSSCATRSMLQRRAAAIGVTPSPRARVGRALAVRSSGTSSGAPETAATRGVSPRPSSPRSGSARDSSNSPHSAVSLPRTASMSAVCRPTPLTLGSALRCSSRVARSV
mmetsp:Transcript_95911/g.256330  ORF Transcript_95911/g.256330 Transcript_95911/m.256330 type:complete len:350 (-) Transcript_95911:553-1602(-)